MAEQIDIQIKTGRLADLPALAEINRSAYAEELVTRIAYPAWPDEVNMLNMFLARLGDRLTDPDSHVCKAIDVVSGKIVGFACWTLQHGAGEKSAYTSPTKKAMQQSTAGLNLKFVTAMAVDAEALATHRKATERYYCKVSVRMSSSTCHMIYESVPDVDFSSLSVCRLPQISTQRHRYTFDTPLYGYR